MSFLPRGCIPRRGQEGLRPIQDATLAMAMFSFLAADLDIDYRDVAAQKRELAAAGWNPEAGFAAYEGRMRSFVEANQEIGRLHARSLDVPGPDAEPSPEFDPDGLTELVERAINGVELPDYAGVPDSGAPAGPPITSSARS
jgi:hypothetical protein